MLTPTERALRARIAAHAMHAAGKTNTAPATAASMARFEREVDPDGILDPEERARRAMHARKAYYTRLSFEAAKAKRAKRRAAGHR